MERKLGERAVTIAYITDRDGLRSLFQASSWLERELPSMEDPATRLRGSILGSCVLAIRRGFRPHPVRRLIDCRLASRNVSRRGRRNLVTAYEQRVGATRLIVDAWLRLPEGVEPHERALELTSGFFRANGEVSRELVALRTVQTLSVLDVRNYRDLVFRLGRYAEDGEDPALSQALP